VGHQPEFQQPRPSATGTLSPSSQPDLLRDRVPAACRRRSNPFSQHPALAGARLRADRGRTERSLATDVPLDGRTNPFKDAGRPRHFYDARGPTLFAQICERPEDYPTAHRLAQSWRSTPTGNRERGTVAGWSWSKRGPLREPPNKARVMALTHDPPAGPVWRRL